MMSLEGTGQLIWHFSRLQKLILFGSQVTRGPQDDHPVPTLEGCRKQIVTVLGDQREASQDENLTKRHKGTISLVPSFAVYLSNMSDLDATIQHIIDKDSISLPVKNKTNKQKE